jgi:hypothetical protein
MILGGATSLLLKIWTFLGPNGTRFAGAISGPTKILDFQGPPLPVRNDVAPLKIITYSTIKTTGTLIVIIKPIKQQVQ